MTTDWDKRNRQMIAAIQQGLNLQADGLFGESTKQALKDKGIAFPGIGDMGPISPVGPPPIERRDKETMRIDRPGHGDWKQFVEPLKGKHLGDNPKLDLFKKSGCLVCCIANALSAMSHWHESVREVEPLALSIAINNRGGFDENSVLRWPQVVNALHDLTGIKWTYSHQGLSEIFPLLNRRIVPIVKVKRGRGSHFVTAHKVSESQVYIQDPGTGNHHKGADQLYEHPKGYEPDSLRVLEPVP